MDASLMDANSEKWFKQQFLHALKVLQNAVADLEDYTAHHDIETEGPPRAPNAEDVSAAIHRIEKLSYMWEVHQLEKDQDNQ